MHPVPSSAGRNLITATSPRSRFCLRATPTSPTGIWLTSLSRVAPTQGGSLSKHPLRVVSSGPPPDREPWSSCDRCSPMWGHRRCHLLQKSCSWDTVSLALELCYSFSPSSTGSSLLTNMWQSLRDSAVDQLVTIISAVPGLRPPGSMALRSC